MSDEVKVKRPAAVRTEQWEWTATMDGHRATATSEQGAKYRVVCDAYDTLESRLREYQLAQSEHDQQIAKMEDKRRHALDRLRERDEWKQAYAELSRRHDKVLRERDEWKARCLTVESSEEDAQQAAVKFREERDEWKCRAEAAETRLENRAHPFVTMAKYDRDIERLRRENARLSGVLREALQSFQITQSRSLYRDDHWCNKAATLLATEPQTAPTQDEVQTNRDSPFGPVTNDELDAARVELKDAMLVTDCDTQRYRPEKAKTETCKWKKTRHPYSAAWWPGCDPTEEGPSVDDWAMEHCPYCAKPIEIVSEEAEDE